MISISIGETERGLADATPDWINRQINRRRDNRGRVCVRVRIDCPGVRVTLASPACRSGVGTRPPNRDEQRIFALWGERGLDNEDFTGGNLVAFLRQLQDLVGAC